MNRRVQHLITRIQSEEQTATVRRLRGLLVSPDVRITAESKTGVTVGELLLTWSTRQKVAKYNKRRILGLADLLQELKSLPTDTNVLVSSVVDERDSGAIFFSKETGRFLGGVVAPMSQHTKSYYQGDLRGRPFEQESFLAKIA